MNVADHILADDTAHWKQYERLIQQLAGKALPRAQALEPTMDYDELVGMFTETYLKCKTGFDPTKGYQFTTYLQSAIYHSFNKWCEQVGRQRRAVAATSINDLAVAGGREESNPYEYVGVDQGESPEEQVERRQRRTLMAQRVATLPPRFKQVVAILVKGPGPELRADFEAHQAMLRAQGRQVPEDITIDFICRKLDFTMQEALKLREVLEQKFKVTVPSLNYRAFR